MNRLPQHLLRPELAPVWREYARRLCRGDRPTTLTLRDLQYEQQRAIADLLGRDRLPGKTMRLSVAQLLAACKLDTLQQLQDVTEAVTGPIVNRKMEREHQRKIKLELWQWLGNELLELPNVDAIAVDGWLAQQQSKGVSYQHLQEHRDRYQQMLAVLKRLPANGESLAVLAADVLGDPHALDSVTPLGRLCIGAWCALNQIPLDHKAISVRRQWAWAGVILDGVSSTVLALGLRQSHDRKLTEWLSCCADNHEPVVLTYRQISRWPIRALVNTEKAVIVENPSIIEAAADAGISSIPLICSAGQPTVTVQRLVGQLRAAGGEVYQHADFDPAGMHISRWFQAHTGTTPWKMTERDYLQALKATESPTVPLDAQPIPETPWDRDLARAMRQHQIYVSEERVRVDLLEGIASVAPG